MADPLSVLTEEERDAFDRLRRLLSGESIYRVYHAAPDHAVRRNLARADLNLLATELAALRAERADDGEGEPLLRCPQCGKVEALDGFDVFGAHDGKLFCAGCHFHGEMVTLPPSPKEPTP